MDRIGILQLTQNLDDAVRGFKAGLAVCGRSAAFEYRNADGNAALLPKLAQDLLDRGAKLIFACSTPAAQAAVALAADVPVVFTPVFDPVGAGLAATMYRPGGKATGMAGMVPAAAKVAFIRRLLPAARNIALLHYEGDANSRLEVANFKTAASDYGLIDLPFAAAEDLSALGELLPPATDALFIPIGRLVEENFATIAYYAELAAMPIIAANAGNVAAGALGALVADHYKLGIACAGQAVQILDGAEPGAIPVGIVNSPDIILNRTVADSLGITLASDLLAAAREIFE
jgi:putative ABC transport system substrate-binding protein